MLITLINRSKKIKSDEVHTAIRAVNRQIREDFAPYWGMDGQLRLEGSVGAHINKRSKPDLRGDAVLYLLDTADTFAMEGYHVAHAYDIPSGYVFKDLSDQVGDPWTVTLSHEVLELLANPLNNLQVQGPHPADPKKLVFHGYEMCDAVQAEMYAIEGVQLSNFVLPSYFSLGEQLGRRNDFLGRHPLRSFGINPGGYVSVYDPATNTTEAVAAADVKARKRLKLKSRAQTGRVHRATQARSGHRA